MDNNKHYSIFPAISRNIVNAYEGKTILITGAQGYIGSALSAALAELNCKLILMDNTSLKTRKPKNPPAEIVQINGDISERNTWENIPQDIDFVFHLAAREYYYRAEYDPEGEITSNMLPILHILERCRTQSLRPKVVFASSANLYGLVDSLPVNEEKEDNLLTVWAINKQTAERYLRLYGQKFDINSVTLRLANVYGPSIHRSIMTRVVLNKVIHQALNRRTIFTYSNRICIRDYIFLSDVVQAFLLAGIYCVSERNPIYLIGSGEGKIIANVWHLIAKRVKEMIHKDVIIKYDDSIEIEPIEFRNFIADSARFQNATGWQPKIKLTQGIDITIKAFLSDKASKMPHGVAKNWLA